MTFQTNRLKHIGENNTEEMAGTDSKKIAKQMLNLRVKMRATDHAKIQSQKLPKRSHTEMAKIKMTADTKCQQGLK